MDLFATHADARHDPLRSAGVIFGALLVTAALLKADGGRLQFRKPAGPFVISVFSAPVPVRVGEADFSVMVQRSKDQSTVLDANVRLRLVRSTPDNVLEIVVPATRAQATNKFLYAGRVKLPSEGQWRLEAQVAEKGEAADASGDMTVLPAQTASSAYWPYFALPPAALFAFALNQWLKGKRRIRHPRAQP